MSNYLQLSFSPVTQAQSEILIALLSENGFDGFSEENNCLQAYLPEDDYDEENLSKIAENIGVNFSKTVIEEVNWNAIWESNFQPVVVDDFVCTRAHFHDPVLGVEHDIVITPKMSFGTGHHATTYLMMQEMREIDFTNKSVFDFGTGTGVLAILAEKLGAATITAVDNDDWSIDNAAENLLRNNCTLIDLHKSDNPGVEPGYEIILANINKNVIIENMQLLAANIVSGGKILLSGLLVTDEADIVTKAKLHGFRLLKKSERNGWICLIFSN